MRAGDRVASACGSWLVGGSRHLFWLPTQGLFLVAVAVFFTGCVWSVPQPKLVREPRPPTVPLRIGVYYAPKLRWFVYWHHPTDTAWVLGKPSARLLNDAFTLLFSHVEIVSRPAGASSGGEVEPRLAGVIEPRIVSAAYDCCAGGVRASITYGFTLYSPRGDPVASWSVTGVGTSEGSNPFRGVSYVRQSFERAMRDAVWKLTSEFQTVAEIRRWLTEQGVALGR